MFAYKSSEFSVFARRETLCILVALTAVTTASAAMSYLDNGIIEIGVNTSKGGAITYMADSGGNPHTLSGNNIINDWDLGRQVQMSYFIGPDNYNPNNCVGYDDGCVHPDWYPFAYNPIQAGDVFNHGSQTLTYSNNGDEIYVKCIPKHWHLNNVPASAIYEAWIKLEGSAARVRCRFTHDRGDTTQYSARSGELPAVYTVGTLHNLVSYTGNQPFTSGSLTEFGHTCGPWDYWRANEYWSALVNDDDWGLGIYHERIAQSIGGFCGTPGSGGPNDSQCGYMSPIPPMVADHNIMHEYKYTLILGNLSDIRTWVYQYQPDSEPNYQFFDDRHYCRFVNCSDTGWPIIDQLRLKLNGADPRVIGPMCSFYASDVPTIYIRARHDIANPGGDPLVLRYS